MSRNFDRFLPELVIHNSSSYPKRLLNSVSVLSNTFTEEGADSDTENFVLFGRIEDDKLSYCPVLTTGTVTYQSTTGHIYFRLCLTRKIIIHVSGHVQSTAHSRRISLCYR